MAKLMQSIDLDANYPSVCAVGLIGYGRQNFGGALRWHPYFS